MAQQLHCTKCGELMSVGEQICHKCGAVQESFRYRSRVAAATLAIFGGMFGLHRFFLGQWWGIFYLLFFWTYIPWLIGIIEGIVFLSTSQESWNRKYNHSVSLGTESGTVVVIFAILLPMVMGIGILAAVAIPAYNDYLKRAMITEGLSMAAPAKTAITGYVLRENAWPENNVAAGMDEIITGKYVDSLEIEGGVIYINMAPDTGIDGELILVPTFSEGAISWSCKESTVTKKYLPAACK